MSKITEKDGVMKIDIPIEGHVAGFDISRDSEGRLKVTDPETGESVTGFKDKDGKMFVLEDATKNTKTITVPRPPNGADNFIVLAGKKRESVLYFYNSAKDEWQPAIWSSDDD